MNIYKNILIIRTDRIGDVVLTTPTIKALHKFYPKSKVSILVTPLTKPLIENNPYLNEVIVDDRRGEHKGALGFWKLVSEIRKKKYDLAIVLHTKKRTNALCFFAGIPRRIGYKNNKFGFLLTHPIEDVRHYGKQHEAQYCLDVLKSVDIESKDLELYISIENEAEQWVSEFCRVHKIDDKNKLIAIHPGASDPAKCWPAHCFAELIEQLYAKYHAKCVIVGASNIQNITQKIISSTQHSIIDLTGKTTVSQLVSILKRADMLVSNDSGPVHIAAALQTPVISIFTRNQPGINPERWHPLGNKSREVVVAQKRDVQYAKKIMVDEVFEAVDAQFKLC
ncbi:ADP-heptose--lipooligosaccharide heptosyltransferase II [hydrothermal vent metagenome]|uniref:lipopolysaccharide heptosyltransferase II n=1 Tax=hydrothermal vent metagenome TaxID=652676 RepID=A0A3B1DKC5_9ZZZZ